jgi:hypothetical protein
MNPFKRLWNNCFGIPATPKEIPPDAFSANHLESFRARHRQRPTIPAAEYKLEPKPVTTTVVPMTRTTRHAQSESSVVYLNQEPNPTPPNLEPLWDVLKSHQSVMHSEQPTFRTGLGGEFAGGGADASWADNPAQPPQNPQPEQAHQAPLQPRSAVFAPPPVPIPPPATCSAPTGLPAYEPATLAPADSSSDGSDSSSDSDSSSGSE